MSHHSAFLIALQIGHLPAAKAWFGLPTTADDIALTALTVSGLGILTSGFAALAAWRSFKQMEKEHRSETRPQFVVKLTASSLQALVSGDRFDVADQDGMALGLVVENVGRGRGSDVAANCEVLLDTATRRRLAKRRTTSLGVVGGQSLSMLAGSAEVTTAWETPDATMHVSSWPTTQAFHARLNSIDVDGQVVVPIPESVLRGWIQAAIALQEPITMRCRVTGLSGAAEWTKTDAMIVLQPRVQSVIGDVLDLRFTPSLAESAPRTPASRRAEAARRRQDLQFIKDVKQRARALQIEADDYFKATR